VFNEFRKKKKGKEYERRRKLTEITHHFALHRQRFLRNWNPLKIEERQVQFLFL